MPRREWPLHFKCAHAGCDESTTFRYDTKRDLQHSYELRHYGGGRWKCLRHDKPDRVLSENNRQTCAELIVEQKQYGKYFGSSGLISGPGFLAYAEDLPVGTKLIVTAQIELPPTAERPLVGCAAARDGECTHSQCPQVRDNEPRKSGRHCPIDNWGEDD